MLNPIEKFKVAILHLNRAWNHCYGNDVIGSALFVISQCCRPSVEWNTDCRHSSGHYGGKAGYYCKMWKPGGTK